MGISIDGGKLRRELVRRGMSASELARASRLGVATVSAALAGKRIATGSIRLIAKTLAEMPVLEGIDDLLTGHDLDL